MLLPNRGTVREKFTFKMLSKCSNISLILKCPNIISEFLKSSKNVSTRRK